MMPRKNRRRVQTCTWQTPSNAWYLVRGFFFSSRQYSASLSHRQRELKRCYLAELQLKPVPCPLPTPKKEERRNDFLGPCSHPSIQLSSEFRSGRCSPDAEHTEVIPLSFFRMSPLPKMIKGIPRERAGHTQSAGSEKGKESRSVAPHKVHHHHSRSS